MSDDDEIDASDWLAGQFEPTGQVPKQTPAEQSAPQQPAPPVQPTVRLPQQPPVAQTPAAQPPVAAQPPAAQPPVAQPPVAQPPFADAPSPNTQGGFNWGLRTANAEGTTAIPTQPAADPFPPAPPASIPPAPTYAAPAAPAPAPQAPPVAPVFPTSPSYQAPPPEAFPPQYTEPTVPYVPPVYDPAQSLPPTEAYQPPPAQPAATAPFSWEDFAATQAPPEQPPVPTPLQPTFPGEQPTEAYSVQPWEPAAASIPPVYPPTSPPVVNPVDEQPHEPTSALDALFGEQQFQEYEEVGVLQTIQTIPGTGTGTGTEDAAPKPPREPIPRQQRILMIVAGALVALLALVGLFFLGKNIGAAQAAPQPTSTAGPSAAPTSAATGGPAAPGKQLWSALQGGECLQPFSSPWVTTFTVVDCTADHQGEMVFKGTLPDVAGAPYPNGATFATELTPLCSAATALNYSAASAVTDLQISFSYPASQDEWENGDRTYYCFVNRASSGNLPGDLAVKTGQ